MRLNESVVFMIYKMALYPTKKLDYTIIVTVCRDYDIKVEEELHNYIVLITLPTKKR